MTTVSLLPDGWQPERFATLIYVIKNDEILMIEKLRGHGRGKVNAPGGHIELGETPAECAIRELFEEVRLTVLEVEEVANLKFFDTKNGFSMQGYVFKTCANECIGIPTQTEEAIPFWVDINAIPYDRMWEDDAIWLPRVLAGNYIDAELVFADDVLTSWRISAG